MLSGGHVFQPINMADFFFCRGLLKDYFNQIILESDKKTFKIMAFLSISDATATQILHRI